jgi:hypothetical protein
MENEHHEQNLAPKIIHGGYLFIYEGGRRWKLDEYEGIYVYFPFFKKLVGYQFMYEGMHEVEMR